MPRRARPPVSSELEGFVTGVRHRLHTRREAGRPDPPSESRLEQVVAMIRRGELRRAERELLALDLALDAGEEESELTELPRGLVSYTPKGPRGAPPSAEEDRLANRLLLVQRLARVRAAEGRAVDPLLARLRSAETLLRQGDRRAAQREIDAVHRALDAGEDAI